jgi:hypothetical protein
LIDINLGPSGPFWFGVTMQGDWNQAWDQVWDDLKEIKDGK